MYRKNYKMIIIGDSGVGKTSLVRKFSRNTFSESHNMTVGVEFESKDMIVLNQKVELQIWDTVIQQGWLRKIQIINKSMLKSEASFHNVKMWFDEAQENIQQKVVFVLIGAKIDLQEERKITYEQGIQLMNDLKMDLFFETSAKNDIDIEKMFRQSTERIIQQNLSIQKNENKTKLKIKDNKKKNKKNCC